MKKPPMIICPRCEGVGKVALSPDLFDTLALIEKRGRATSNEIKATLDPDDSLHASAFNNRMEDLRKLGLVNRERRGRNWVYFVVKK